MMKRFMKTAALVLSMSGLIASAADLTPGDHNVDTSSADFTSTGGGWFNNNTFAGTDGSNGAIGDAYQGNRAGTNNGAATLTFTVTGAKSFIVTGQVETGHGTCEITINDGTSNIVDGAAVSFKTADQGLPNGRYNDSTVYEITGLDTAKTYTVLFDTISGYAVFDRVSVRAVDYPTNVQLTDNTSGTSFAFSWDAVAGATDYTVIVATDNQFSSVVHTNTTVATTTYTTPSSLSGGTRYYYGVKANTNAGTSFTDYSIDTVLTPVTLTTVDATNGNVVYTITSPWSLDSRFQIKGVAANGENSTTISTSNLTPVAYLDDFSSTQSITLTRGGSYSFDVTLRDNNNGAGWVDGKVWVDWNRDGDFADAGEDLGLIGNGTSKGQREVTVTKLITVPSGASIGNTRMRIRVADSGGNLDSTMSPDSNSPVSYGTAQDYTIAVQAGIVEITAYDAIADITVNQGDVNKDQVSELGLPSTVTIANTAFTRDVDSWVDTDSYDNSTLGSYTFTANLSSTIPAGYKDDNPETVTVEVVVKGLYLHYKFDEADGATIAADSSGNGHDSQTLPGSVVLDSNSIKLTAANDSVKTPTNLTVSGNYVTLAGWVKTSDVTKTTGVITRRTDGGNTNEMGLSIAAGKINYNWNNENNTWQWGGSTPVVADEWNFVAIVIEPTQATSYSAIDTADDLASAVNAVNHAPLTLDHFVVGQDAQYGNAGDSFRTLIGNMKDMRVWNRSLSGAELETLFDAEKDTVTPAIGLEVSLTDNVLAWRVEEERDVKEYRVLVDGELFDTVQAVGTDTYSLEVPEGDVVLEVVDNSGHVKPYAPANGNIVAEIYSLKEGWNLIAITSDDADLDALKDETVGVVWGWNGTSYEVVDSAKATDAVWVYSPKAKTVRVVGTKSSAVIKLKIGWSMVGPVVTSDVPEAADTVYSWDSVYDIIVEKQNALEQGKGYWIFSL